jgi:hypothetical protein
MVNPEESPLPCGLGFLEPTLRRGGGKKSLNSNGIYAIDATV